MSDIGQRNQTNKYHLLTSVHHEDALPEKNTHSTATILSIDRFIFSLLRYYVGQSAHSGTLRENRVSSSCPVGFISQHGFKTSNSVSGCHIWDPENGDRCTWSQTGSWDPGTHSRCLSSLLSHFCNTLENLLTLLPPGALLHLFLLLLPLPCIVFSFYIFLQASSDVPYFLRFFCCFLERFFGL